MLKQLNLLMVDAAKSCRKVAPQWKKAYLNLYW